MAISSFATEILATWLFGRTEICSDVRNRCLAVMKPDEYDEERSTVSHVGRLSCIAAIQSISGCGSPLSAPAYRVSQHYGYAQLFLSEG